MRIQDVDDIISMGIEEFNNQKVIMASKLGFYLIGDNSVQGIFPAGEMDDSGDFLRSSEDDVEPIEVFSTDGRFCSIHARFAVDAYSKNIELPMGMRVLGDSSGFHISSDSGEITNTYPVIADYTYRQHVYMPETISRSEVWRVIRQRKYSGSKVQLVFERDVCVIYLFRDDSVWEGVIPGKGAGKKFTPTDEGENFIFRKVAHFDVNAACMDNDFVRSMMDMRVLVPKPYVFSSVAERLRYIAGSGEYASVRRYGHVPVYLTKV